MSESESDASYRVTASELRQFVERIERLDAEKKDLAEQQKAFFDCVQPHTQKRDALHLIDLMKKMSAVVEAHKAREKAAVHLSYS